MEVILLERVENLGAIGDVVKVKNGFARNFLLPQHKALLATDANKARFERERAAIEARNEKAKAAAQGEGQALDGTTYVLIRQAGETGQLYGSVAARDIVEAEKPFRLLLRARPTFELPASTPPKIMAVFRKVQVEEQALFKDARRDIRMADRPKKDRVLPPQQVEAAFRNDLARLQVAVAAPVERFDLVREALQS
jgi:ribosomal protein L9